MHPDAKTEKQNSKLIGRHRRDWYLKGAEPHIFGVIHAAERLLG
jgi:hypothetical protein